MTIGKFHSGNNFAIEYHFLFDGKNKIQNLWKVQTLLLYAKQ